MEWLNKKAVVTGASSGIGAETAVALAKQGVDLFLVARRQAKLSVVSERCFQAGAMKVITEIHDLSRPGVGKIIVENCLRELKGLDFLICNAGYGIFGPTRSTSPSKMAQIWQVNFQSAYESIHCALPYFSAKGTGHIVLTSSIVGKKAMPYAAAYTATKFAQVGLGEALWGELREIGVGVTVVCPGFTASEFHATAERVASSPMINRSVSGQSPRIVGKAIVNAIGKNQREIHLTLLGKLLLILDRISPALATRVMSWVGNRELKPENKKTRQEMN